MAAREPSNEFLEAVGNGIGGPSLHCSCGRTHYAPDSNVVGEHEREDMLAHAIEAPTKVVIHEREDAVHANVLNGLVCVSGCECSYMARYEESVWTLRATILDYYRRRREADSNALAKLDSALNEVKQ